ncbi:DUF5050 domain-containing protein [Clostridium fermenticellae]|nr:DUF5050 domain-containing protein [Clostridium fermenticellae]
MKRTKLLVLSVVLALGIPMTAHAFPSGKQVLVIGNRAYDISNIETLFTNSDFINYVSNNYKNMYYVDSTGGDGPKINDVFGEGTINEQELINRCGDRINYYSGVNESLSDYWVTQNGEYKMSSEVSDPNSPINTSQFITLELSSKAIAGNLYLYNFKIDKIVGVPGAAYYSVGSSSNKLQFSNNTSYMINVENIGTGIPIYIYSSDMKTKIATAMLTSSELTNSDGTAITEFTVKTVKFSSVINPISPIMSRWMVLGNMSNGGMLDCDSNYIYYVNTADGNKIYKKNSYGTENYAINNDSSGYITVYGDWIYYCNYSDGAKIYKVKIDGTERQKISDNKGTYLNVIGDKLYYINGSDRNRIYSLDSAGNSTKLGDDEASYLELGVNNNLFYSNVSNSRNLYQIDTYGNNVKVDNLDKSNPASYINVSINSSVAYYSSSDGYVYRSGDPYNPIKISIQTSSGLVTDKVSNINISNNTMYYKSLVDGGKLYKVGSNGGVAQKISNDSVDGIFVYSYNGTKDDVYYTKSGKLYMISGDDLNSSSTVPKATAITKPKSNLKIKSISTIPTVYTDASDSKKTIDKIDVLRYLPAKVSVTMSDGSILQIPVNWDITNYKAKNGIYTYSGTLVGYGNKVTVDFAIASTSQLNSGNTTAYNEVGKNDTVTINNSTLDSGDVVKVYDVKDSSKVAKTATIDQTGGTVIGGLDFGTYSGSVKITVTEPGKAEGTPYYAPFGPERGTAPSILGSTLANTKLEYSTDSTSDESLITISGIQLTLSSNDQIYVGSKTDASAAGEDDANWIDISSIDSKYGTWNSSTGVLTINGDKSIGWITVKEKDLKFGGNGLKIFIRQKGNPASQPAVFVVNPRISAPYGVTFDETNKMIRGTTSREEYSIDGGSTWNTCSDNNTYIGTFPQNIPVRVRIKATQATLASLETEQVMVTDMSGDYTNVAITNGNLNVDSNGTPYSDSEGNYCSDNTIELKSSIPVTWRVTDSNGQSTSKASIKQLDSTHAILTGYENGVVTVIATSTDGSYLQGNLNVNISNQKVITVNDSTQLNNAVNAGIKVIKLIGIGGNYYLNSLPGSGTLAIVGQDTSSVLNISGNLASVGSNISNLSLKNMTVRGNGSSSVGDFITVSSGMFTADNVSFDSINGSSIISQAGGNIDVKNCRFLPSNKIIQNIVANNGSIKNNTFTGNSGQTNELGALNASGNVIIQGNTFTNYLNNDGYAIKLSSGFSSSNVGGVSRDSWNIINNCNIGIWLPSGDNTTLNTNNSIDVKTVSQPIKVTN